ncbi:hypothetical protein GW16_03860 [Xanthomonas arboricola pv. celebensis]|uniref:hypothetical protein n=1 Tax=Xanthomonas TaxID=338 RepID=UPI0004D592E3|nr:MULTISPECIES: hypothetical protein [Xanthomonas]KER87979.1 hypothetical protein GW16_03860 [Xanthomonas arboricola pv. celebensis]MBB5865044.1 hypothetical protein [Xanthomonas sp. 3058]PPT95381.1 hypothetical protein XaraCFBP7407_11720 [Xanthomonas arboricola pv. arracaciae]
MQWKQKIVLGFAMGLALLGNAQAGSSSARQLTEASMNVSGTLTLTPEGVVTAVALKDEAQLPVAVRERVKHSIAAWRFDPVKDDGSALPATLPMNLLLVAKPTDDNRYLISIRSAHFGGEAQDVGSVRSKDMQPPAYPVNAFRGGATGVVYLLLKIGRTGKVEDVVAEQVNLTALVPESKRARWRQEFADASMSKARHWEFLPPTEGPDVNAPFWVMRVPVTFEIASSERDLNARQKQWQAYLPGPRQAAPWRNERSDAVSIDSPDALSGYGLFSVRGEGVRLATPLQEG